MITYKRTVRRLADGNIDLEVCLERGRDARSQALRQAWGATWRALAATARTLNAGWLPFGRRS